MRITHVIALALALGSTQSHAMAVKRILENKTPPLVLCYHDIVENGESSATSDSFINTFRAQIDWLESQGYTSISVQEFYDWKVHGTPLPNKAVLLTFDDDYIGNYLYAYPYLKSRNLKGTFFVQTSTVGVVNSKVHMSWDQLREIESSPLFHVYPHSVTHLKYFTVESESELIHELRDSREVMEQNLGGSRPFTAYPFGVYNAQVISVAERYYLMAFSLDNNSHGINPLFQEDRMIVDKIKNPKLQQFQAQVMLWNLSH